MEKSVKFKITSEAYYEYESLKRLFLKYSNKTENQFKRSKIKLGEIQCDKK